MKFEQFFMGKKDTSIVAKIFLFNGDKCLALQKPNKKWQLPGGHIQQGESVKNGLEREVYEETGIKDFTYKLINKKNNFYLYQGNTNVCNVKLSEEHIAYKWINISELSKYDLTNNTRTRLKYV